MHDPLGKEAQAKAGGGAAQLARFPGVAGEHGLDEVRPQVPREPRPLSTFAEPRSKVDAKLKEVRCLDEAPLIFPLPIAAPSAWQPSSAATRLLIFIAARTPGPDET